ncbi:MAG: hypothetical protein L3V56_04395 [Candidatus Magnetoovum sp. WYHC-5]|nr:hypothetical protein [Candidatus Magnetoovum sp. WYHC-5]
MLKKRYVYNLGSGVVFFILMAMFLLSRGDLSFAANGIDRLVLELNALIEEHERQGKDTKNARELDIKSRGAFQSGRFEEAEKLLQKAIDTLKGNEALPSSKSSRGTLNTTTNKVKAEKAVRAEASALEEIKKKFVETPFAVFGPYEYTMDTKTISRSTVNQYLKELGVQWVQEMPFDVDRLPINMNICSRVGREGGFEPPSGELASYEKALMASVNELKTKVKCYEIDTEESGLTPPNGWKGYPKEYVEFLKVSYGAIKAECPECLVILGGLPGVGVNLTKNSDEAEFLADMLKYGASNYFDVFSFKQHHYNDTDYQELGNKLNVYSSVFLQYGINLSDMPIMVETAMHDGEPSYGENSALSWLKLKKQTEKEQAAALVKVYVYGAYTGIDKVFWNQIVERHNFGGDEGNPFNFYGLVNNPANKDKASHKKLAYYTMKKLVEILDGVDWKNIEMIKYRDDCLMFKFDKSGKKVWVAWYDGGDEVDRVEMLGLTATDFKVTYVIPDYSSGKDVKDYDNSFKTLLLKANAGSITVEVKDIPAIIEEQ